MGQRHKHADVIIAWAEGKEVECRSSPDRPWTPMTNRSSWYGFDDVEYRIKPPAKKYRVALFRKYKDDELLVVAANSQETADNYESMPDFVRWLTDWIEYEE